MSERDEASDDGADDDDDDDDDGDADELARLRAAGSAPEPELSPEVFSTSLVSPTRRISLVKKTTTTTTTTTNLNRTPPPKKKKRKKKKNIKEASQQTVKENKPTTLIFSIVQQIFTRNGERHPVVWREKLKRK